MGWYKRWKDHRQEHERVKQHLDDQAMRVFEMTGRVRLLEREAGIFRPQRIKGVNGQ